MDPGPPVWLTCWFYGDARIYEDTYPSVEARVWSEEAQARHHIAALLSAVGTTRASEAAVRVEEGPTPRDFQLGGEAANGRFIWWRVVEIPGVPAIDIGPGPEVEYNVNP